MNSGGKPHHYHFRLYALKVPKLDVPADAPAALIGFNVNANSLQPQHRADQAANRTDLAAVRRTLARHGADRGASRALTDLSVRLQPCCRHFCCTVNAMFVLSLIEPAVPVTVTMAVPAGASEEAMSQIILFQWIAMIVGPCGYYCRML